MGKKRRFFNAKEKEALRILSGDRCEACGKELGNDWHADHIKPWSKGGKTETQNSQALCKYCNLKKGKKMNLKNYSWQNDCFDSWRLSSKINFLMNACPGAGKTRCASFCANDFKEKRKGKIIIICPNDTIKIQWCKEMANKNISITPDLSNDKLNKYGTKPLKNWDGCVFSYAQLARNSEIANQICHRFEALAILDEIHHCSSEYAWGTAVREGLKNAYRRLLTTGTPWRHGYGEIPFVEYDEKGIVICDYTYSYPQAIIDNIVRTVEFPVQQGRVKFEWHDNLYDVEIDDDNLNEDERRKVLYSATNPYDDKGAFATLIISGLDKLRELRKKYDKAGMIIIGRDIDHIKNIKKYLFPSISPEIDPVLVHSEDPNADLKIEEFNQSDKEVILTVKKISEGVDIKRLQVGVFGSNVSTELFFRQAIGRTLRIPDEIYGMQHYPYDRCWWLIPNIEPFPEMAAKIESEIQIAFKQKEEKEDIEISLETKEKQSDSSYKYIESYGEIEKIIYGGDIFEKKLKVDDSPQYKIARKLRDDIRLKVKSIAGKISFKYYRKFVDEIFKIVYNSLPGGPVDIASIEELKIKLMVLNTREEEEWERIIKISGKLDL